MQPPSITWMRPMGSCSRGANAEGFGKENVWQIKLTQPSPQHHLAHSWSLNLDWEDSISAVCLVIITLKDESWKIISWNKLLCSVLAVRLPHWYLKQYDYRQNNESPIAFFKHMAYFTLNGSFSSVNMTYLGSNNLMPKNKISIMCSEAEMGVVLQSEVSEWSMKD